MRIAAMGVECPNIWELSVPAVDLLVLPELCFTPWLCATRDVEPDAWDAAASEQPLDRLDEFNADVVVGTIATVEGGHRYNDAFCWTRSEGLRRVHRKTFLPNETGFWEATWYERGPVEFTAFDTPVGRIGVSICTEMWFTQHAYPDVDLIVVPRATPIETGAKWLAGGTTHAVTSGAFCVSSNRAETVAGTVMGGTGWIIDPEGSHLAVTSGQEPIVTADIDLEQARRAKQLYPRYVLTD
jgi:N-carbamoylputrescine amidase